MIACEVRVVLDKTEFLPGEEITGYVTLWGDEKWKCKSLDVWFGMLWPETRFAEQHLWSGTMEKDVRQRFRFALKPPTRPLTFDGEHWGPWLKVFARAKLPLAFDPDDNVEVTVAAPPDAHAQIAPRAPGSTALAVGGQGTAMVPALAGPREKLGPRWGMVLLGAGVLGTAGALYVAVPAVPWFVSAYLAPVGAFSMVRGSWRYFAEKKLGGVSVDYDQPLENPEVLRVHTRVGPYVEVNHITARLYVEQRYVLGSGKEKQSFRKVVYDRKRAAAPAMEQGMYSAEIPLPEDIKFSWADKHAQHGVVWLLDVHVDIPNWPDWKETFTLDVTPPSSA